MVLITAVATLALATTFMAVGAYREDEESRSRDWGLILLVTLTGGPLIGAALATVTLPVALFLSGTWEWPLHSWPLWVQIGTLLPVALMVGLFIAFVFASGRDSLFVEEALLMAAGGASVLAFLIVPSVLLAHFASAWPLWVQISIGILWIPVVISVSLAHLLDMFFEESSRVESVLFLTQIWLVVGILLLGVALLTTISLSFLALLPVGALVIALVAAIANSRPAVGYWYWNQ